MQSEIFTLPFCSTILAFCVSEQSASRLTLTVLYHTMPHKLCRFEVRDAQQLTGCTLNEASVCFSSTMYNPLCTIRNVFFKLHLSTLYSAISCPVLMGIDF